MNLRRVRRERGRKKRGEEEGEKGRREGRGEEEEGTRGGRGGEEEEKERTKDRREERIRGGKRDEKRGLGCKHFGHARYHKTSELNKILKGTEEVGVWRNGRKKVSDKGEGMEWCSVREGNTHLLCSG